MSKVFYSYSLLVGQLAEPEGTVDAPYLFILLKVRSETRRHSGVVISSKRAAALFDPRVRLSSSLYASVASDITVMVDWA